LWDLRPQGLTGSKLEKLCDHASITLNKNSVPKDTSALSPGMCRKILCSVPCFVNWLLIYVEVNDAFMKHHYHPGGVRLGAPALTSRGFKEADFEAIADILHQAVQLTLKVVITERAILMGIAPLHKLIGLTGVTIFHIYQSDSREGR
jgi:glycine hydroxymethyltransferase